MSEMTTPALDQQTQQRCYARALGLSVFTILTNIVEGVASTWLGLRDETIALFGFGVDSFIEVISAMGVTYMIARIRRSPTSPRAPFEKTALRVTAVSFFLLAAGLLATAVVNLAQHNAPRTTAWGVVISLLSISVMVVLIALKTHVGRRLGSDPIIADANCTRACVYMSVVLLLSSMVFELTRMAMLDSLGALGIAWFALREGREAWEKARGRECCCPGNRCRP